MTGCGETANTGALAIIHAKITRAAVRISGLLRPFLFDERLIGDAVIHGAGGLLAA